MLQILGTRKSQKRRMHIIIHVGYSQRQLNEILKCSVLSVLYHLCMPFLNVIDYKVIVYEIYYKLNKII